MCHVRNYNEWAYRLFCNIQKDLDFAEKRARRHWTDINNAHERIGSLEDQVISLVQDVWRVRQRMDTAHDVDPRQCLRCPRSARHRPHPTIHSPMLYPLTEPLPIP